MESQDRALRGTAATPELWGGAYMMLVFALLSRGLRAWQQMSGSPVASDQIVEVVIGMLLCPAPLIMGIAFRRLIKSELRKNSSMPAPTRSAIPDCPVADPGLHRHGDLSSANTGLAKKLPRTELFHPELGYYRSTRRTSAAEESHVHARHRTTYPLNIPSGRSDSPAALLRHPEDAQTPGTSTAHFGLTASTSLR